MGSFLLLLLLLRLVAAQGAISGATAIERGGAPSLVPEPLGPTSMVGRLGCELAHQHDASALADGTRRQNPPQPHEQPRSEWHPLEPWTPGKAWHRLPRSSYPAHGAFDHPHDAIKHARSGRWNTSDFPLLLCIGQGKTATKSLNKAFVMLGMKTAHFYGAGVYGLLYDNAAEPAKEGEEHSFMFNVNEPKHVNAVLDTPVVDFYNEILLSYPKAKVILTIRKPDSWLRSQQKFYANFARSCRNWLAPWRRGSNLVYGTECPSKEQAIKRYVQHNRNVYDSVPPERLLIMDIPAGDGWEKLCDFLGPDSPGPCPPTNLAQCKTAGVDTCVFPSRK